MTAYAPLNITLSIGEVSFQLAPSPNTAVPPPSLSSPQKSSRMASASPYAAQKRQRRRRLTPHTVPTRPIHNERCAPRPFTSPIVAIHRGISSHIPTATPSANVSSPAMPKSPLGTPLRRRAGRARTTKDGIDLQDSRRNIGAAGDADASKTPSFSPGRNTTGGRDGYFVDLHSFTGTLHITKSGNSESMATPKNRDQSVNNLRKPLFQNVEFSSTKGDKVMDFPRPLPIHSFVNSSRKRSSIAGNHDTYDAGSISFSKKRTKSFSSDRISSNENDVEATLSNDVRNADGDNDDYRGEDCGNFNETASSAGQGLDGSKKNARFSMRHQDSIIYPPLKEGESLSDGGSFSVPNLNVGKSHNSGPNDNAAQNPQSNTTGTGNQNENSMAQIPSPPHVQQQQPHQKPRNKHFFPSPPTTTFASPPWTTMATARASVSMGADMARETSSVLARSGIHVLKQVALAGKDAYDALSGDAVLSPSRFTKNRKHQRGAPDSGGRGDFLDSNESVYDALDGTELHYACASDNLAHIRGLLEYDSQVDLFKADCEGLLPIHLLTENYRLINDDPLGCEEVAFKMIELMGPEKAVQALHPCGLGPLVCIIGMWTEKLHRGALERNSGVAANSAPDENAGTPAKDEDENAPSRRRSVTYRSLFPVLGNDTTLLAATNKVKLLYLPSTFVMMSDHVRWAIGILSRLINEYPEQTREAILTNIASVPLFLKSVLLIEDTDEMKELLDMTLVKHVIVDKRSIDVWLCAMLTDSNEVKIRAVTLMKLLSRMTLSDLAEHSQSPDRYSENEIERFKTLKEETFNAVYVTPEIVPAVLELGGRMIENLSTTSVMRYITDRTIRKTNVFFVLICDFFYVIFLLMGYRLNVEFALNYHSLDGPEHYREPRYISFSIFGIALYFLVKEGMTLLSLYLTSKKLARRYCLTVFKIIDVTSVAMLLGVESALTSDSSSYNGFAASLTIILLWLKLMGSFKILNSAFSLFLYAINEVIKEVKWFIIFLVAVTLMFADAVRTVVAARGDCQDAIDYGDKNEDYLDEFCSDNFFAIIIRMYSVLVGDVSLQYFQSSYAMITVFVFFSFFSIIILLNILIAIIIDSYEGSKHRSREIFHRARIEYAAHLVARKQFLSPRDQTAHWVMRFVYFSVSAIAFLSFEYGFVGAVRYLTLETRCDYHKICFLVVIYVSVAVIFNAYILLMGVIGSGSRYRGGGENSHILMKKAIAVFEGAVEIFHQILGFNADEAVKQGIADASEEFLIVAD